jgi:hypothetical protein
MKTNDPTKSVEDTEENLAACNCRHCPTFRDNRLSECPPGGLFCARERASSPAPVKATSCYCPACAVFTKYGLHIGRLCINK